MLSSDDMQIFCVYKVDEVRLCILSGSSSWHIESEVRPGLDLTHIIFQNQAQPPPWNSYSLGHSPLVTKPHVVGDFTVELRCPRFVVAGFQRFRQAPLHSLQNLLAQAFQVDHVVTQSVGPHALRIPLHWKLANLGVGELSEVIDVHSCDPDIDSFYANIDKYL